MSEINNTLNERGELQKRLDAVATLPQFWREFINGFPHISIDSKVQLMQCADELEQALKGGSNYE